MRYILEGPDNAGKSTLARSLQDECHANVSYNHPGGPPASIEEEFKCLEDQYNLLSKFNFIIQDRVTCVSQQVYNPDEALDPVRRLNLDRLLAIPDLILVYCRPSNDRLMRVQDLTWRPEESEEHKQKIIRNQHTYIDRYDAVIAACPHVLYDYESSDAALVKNLLLNAIDGADRAKTFLRDMTHIKRKT